MSVERKWREIDPGTEVAWEDLVVVRDMFVIMHAVLKNCFGLKPTGLLNSNILDTDQLLLRNFNLTGYCLGYFLIEQRLLTLSIDQSSLARLLEHKVKEILNGVLELPLAVLTVCTMQTLQHCQGWIFHIWDRGDQ